MVRRSIFCLVVALLFFNGGAQEDEQGQGQDTQQGTLQISWVDPEEVTVQLSGPEGYSSETQVTGGQVFTGLAAGTYELTASKEGYQAVSQKIDVAAGGTASTSLTLKQQPGQLQQAVQEGTLQVVWVDPGDVTMQVDGPGGYSSETQVTGGHVFTGLAAGTYELTASKEGYQNASQAVEVKAGETVSTLLTLKQQKGQQPGVEQQDQVEAQAQEQEPEQQAQQLSLETLMAQGEQLYSQAGCSSCHGGDGGGNQGPAFAGNEQLQETEYVAGMILHGRGGMPGFGGRLADEEIASVATYIRNSWENDFGLLSPQEVQGQR